MSAYIETFILYFLLFLWRSTSTGSPGTSACLEILKILLFFIPSLAIIWHFKHKNWDLKQWIVKPVKQDLICVLIALPSLLITGFCIAFLASITGTAQITLNSPASASAWITLSFTCLFSAALEEGFFRFYLISKRNELNLSVPKILILSMILFSLCHLYEGPWGVINAAISGLVLGILFLRFNSIYGIIIAHALYNISAFLLSAINY